MTYSEYPERNIELFLSADRCLNSATPVTVITLCVSWLQHYVTCSCGFLSTQKLSAECAVDISRIVCLMKFKTRQEGYFSTTMYIM